MAYIHQHFQEPNEPEPLKSLYSPLDDELAHFKSDMLQKTARYEQMYLFDENSTTVRGWRS
jgi:hypothetical protein